VILTQVETTTRNIDAKRAKLFTRSFGYVGTTKVLKRAIISIKTYFKWKAIKTQAGSVFINKTAASTGLRRGCLVKKAGDEFLGHTNIDEPGVILDWGKSALWHADNP